MIFKSLERVFTYAFATIFLSSSDSFAAYPEDVPPPMQNAVAGELGLEECVYTSKIEKKDYLADCGTISVPENRKVKNSRLINLPFIRVRATGENPQEPIFWFDGGPGSSNDILYTADGILETHDLIAVGYRGFDGNVKLKCPEISEHIRNFSDDLFGKSAMASYATGAKLCAERLQVSGIDLSGYSMAETVDDMEAVRQALDYDRINLLGKSYGTRVQMIFMWRYPESVKRVTMVAVNTPGRFVWDPDVIEDKLLYYSELCARDNYCSSRTNDLAATMRQVSNNMPKSWMGIAIDPDIVKLVTFFSLAESIPTGGSPIPLYGPGAIDMWLDAAEGDASGIAAASLLGRLILPQLFGNWGHFLSMGASAADYFESDRDYESELRRDDTIIGSPASLFAWAFVREWLASTDQQFYNDIQPSDIETLLISGSVDFSVPFRYSENDLLPALSQGTQLVLREFGHTKTFWHSQPEARSQLLTKFFATGEVDASLYKYQPIIFEVKNAWSGLAKTVLYGGALLTCLILLMGFVLVRAITRRRAG